MPLQGCRLLAYRNGCVVVVFGVLVLDDELQYKM
jgi:hypothetical protein